MCSGSEEGSYLRLTDFVSLNSRRESNKEAEEEQAAFCMTSIQERNTPHLTCRGLKPQRINKNDLYQDKVIQPRNWSDFKPAICQKMDL